MKKRKLNLMRFDVVVNAGERASDKVDKNTKSIYLRPGAILDLTLRKENK